ncbi:MAG TPA: branched-chain amino acid aminotransferase [Acidimicrobiia bacterium]|nr:branched-chain amino acid aminotransferase [Acidimicrobiia bacterium]
MVKPPPFGTVFAPQMAVASFEKGAFGNWEMEKTADFSLHPAAHVFHYGSACFEGLKAHRGLDGSARIFRLDAHAARLVQSAKLLCLPPPPVEITTAMVEEVVRTNRDEIPKAPGSLYLRPTIIGTEANIGAAAHPPTSGLFFVIASPVGDYFSGGVRPLRILIEEETRRSTEGFGMAKTGGNYASALRTVVAARDDFGADQVLFAPNGLVEETGASNFLLISDDVVVTAPLSGSFLHGVTRDSTLRLAERLGYRVEERPLPVREVLEWEGEAALSGTAAVLSGVGTFIHKGEEITIGGGEVGANTIRLRKALTDIHSGAADDPFGWIREV